METRVKRKHKVRKKRLFTAVVLFVLVSVLGVWGFFQVAENNQIRAANALIQQAISDATLALQERELTFVYDEYNFTFTFADFLIYVDEELEAHFDENKVYSVINDINTQITSIEINKNAALIDTLAILTNSNNNRDNDTAYVGADANNNADISNSADDSEYSENGDGHNTNRYVVTLFEQWVRSEQLLVKDLLGSFYTYFNAGETGRNANLQRAAYLINNYVIQPNAIFNMTDNIGPINASNGYQMALVIRDGQFVEGMGGGVCQVSSTLYMAALFAELEIVQRRAHSRLVGYMPPAFDAVLSIPTLNLRFRNTTPHPVTIETIVDFRDSRLTTNIWGTETRPEGRTISFDSVRVAETAEWWTYHLYKYVEYNGIVTRTRMNISGYRVEHEDEITYEEAVAAE